MTAWFVFLLGACQAPSPAEVNPTPEQLKDWVAKLGHPTFAIREAASRELMLAGPICRPFLEAGLNDDSAEIRERCKRLLPSVLKVDLQRQLEAFRKDSEGKLKHRLPGWERFAKSVGTDQASRDLYAAMLMKRPADSTRLGMDARNMAAILKARCTEITNERDNANDHRDNARGKNTLGFDDVEIAWWLFVATDPEVGKHLRSGEVRDDFMVFPYVLRDDLFEDAIRNSPRNGLYQKLLVAWMDTLKFEEAYLEELDFAIEMIKDLDIKAGLAMVVRGLENPRKENTLAMMATALTAVGKLGDKSHLPLLTKYLSNTEIYTETNINRRNIKVEYRDIALAMTLHLQGLKPADFGFNRESRGQLFFAYYLGFTDEKARTQAFAAYADWLYR
jgi:hypothetical protein